MADPTPEERARRLCPDRDFHKLIYERRGEGNCLACGEIETEIRAAEEAARAAQREEDARIAASVVQRWQLSSAYADEIAAAIRAGRKEESK